MVDPQATNATERGPVWAWRRRADRLRAGVFTVMLAMLGLAGQPSSAQSSGPSAGLVNCSTATAGLKVPGALWQKVTCVGDLSTRTLSALNLTDPSDWGTLHSVQTRNTLGTFAGVQLDGYFPDSSTTNTTNGLFHDAQFVIRLPQRWNGKLVITGAPGVRKQYANDYLLSDWFISRGYAYASTDKGNTGVAFYNDGVMPGDAIVEWHHRVRELTLAAKQVVQQHYGQSAKRTYMTGLSNGGYLTRFALENSPELFDGGVDWEGALWTEDGQHLLNFLPPALKHYPGYRAGEAAAHRAILDAGFAPGSEFIWDHHYAVYWDLTQRTYREEMDPSWDGAITAGLPFCLSGTPMCDADYSTQGRPPEVAQGIRRISLTGKIGKPMITLHGTLDSLLPISRTSDPYARMIRKQGLGHRHRYYIVEGGNHVDSLYDQFPDRIRPISPCYRSAFLALEAWVEQGKPPPADHTIPLKGTDPANLCRIGDYEDRPGSGLNSTPVIIR